VRIGDNDEIPRTHIRFEFNTLSGNPEKISINYIQIYGRLMQIPK